MSSEDRFAVSDSLSLLCIMTIYLCSSKKFNLRLWVGEQAEIQSRLYIRLNNIKIKGGEKKENRVFRKIGITIENHDSRVIFGEWNQRNVIVISLTFKTFIVMKMNFYCWFSVRVSLSIILISSRVISQLLSIQHRRKRSVGHLYRIPYDRLSR